MAVPSSSIRKSGRHPPTSDKPEHMESALETVGEALIALPVDTSGTEVITADQGSSRSPAEPSTAASRST